MNKYRVYQHPSGKTVAIKIGFSWPAFLLSGFWAISKKLWLPALSLLFLNLTIKFLEWSAKANNSDIPYIVGAALGILVLLIFGMFGNTWLQNRLESQGYQNLGGCMANDTNDAIAHISSKNLTHHSSGTGLQPAP